jgi:peptidoglycan/LPS O-acetylase OafA/YrhL
MTALFVPIVMMIFSNLSRQFSIWSASFMTVFYSIVLASALAWSGHWHLRFLRSKILREIASISYMLYLVHGPAALAVAAYIGAAQSAAGVFGQAALATALSVSISFLSRDLIERPALTYRRTVTA